MIFRKPYAIFIKYFKLIHLALATATIYLIYRMVLILNFLNESITTPRFNLSGSVNIDLFDFWIYLTPVLIILVSIMVLSVLVYKQKPYRFYAIALIAFIVIFLFGFYLADYLQVMEVRIMPGQSLSLVRDLVLLCIVIEAIAAIKFLITGIGFDIRSFDFGKDLAELEIDDIDREEFEVEVKVDINKAKRDVFRNVRSFKYAYYENKFRYNVAIFMAIVMLSFVLFNTYRNRVIALSEGDWFVGRQLELTVRESYLTTKNYANVKMIDDTVLLILKMDLVSKSNLPKPLENAYFRIEVGNYSFYHSKKYRDSLFDLGIVYDDQKIGNESQSYLFVFEIPEAFVDRLLVFKYVDDFRFVSKKRGPGIQNFFIDPVSLDNNDDIYVTKLGDNVYFREPILVSSLSVEEYELKEEIKLDYRFCISSNNCFISHEYLRPGYYGNEEMAILRLKGDFNLDERVKHLNLSYVEFLRSFGKLEYVVNGQKKWVGFSQEAKAVRVNTGKNVYLEVPKDLLKAEKIELVVNLRNYTYKHLLKY